MIRIVPALPVHVGILSAQLSESERACFASLGRDARRVIRGFFRQSSYRRTALIEERPIAIWGITGSLCSSSGILWLRLGDRARDLPRLVVELAREELAQMLETRRELVCYIDASDTRAQRFASFFGFDLDEPAVIEGSNFSARRGVMVR